MRARVAAILAVAVVFGCARSETASGQAVVPVSGDNVEITADCTVQVILPAIADNDNDGVLHITSPNITVRFAGLPLRGAFEGTDPDQLSGIGIVVSAPGVTLIGPAVHGFKVGILAGNADALVIDGADVSDNFAQRLRSTPTAESNSDWLHPHQNDDLEWRTNYGAGICVERSSNVTIRNVYCRRTQNGIILDQVTKSRIYDCDCSFLSGWGIALWRSSENVIAQNALDFCVRGYSDGVYNRGQDSAGILMFEQCSENSIFDNSVTHGGDGLFCHAGREALGEGVAGAPAEDRDESWYEDRGCNDNVIVGNDFSDAAAHGLELTFSFDNRIHDNTFRGNAICGIWGGYSQRTDIRKNRFEQNGNAGYGLERGGVNIEHGMSNTIVGNSFVSNACGVHLWWDTDEHLMSLPWARANRARCEENVIALNTFESNQVAVQLRDCGPTWRRANQLTANGTDLEADETSRTALMNAPGDLVAASPRPRAPDVGATTTPVGARSDLNGRDKIVMTEFGPYDYTSPLLVYSGRHAMWESWRVLGLDEQVPLERVHVSGGARATKARDGFNVTPPERGVLVPYTLSVDPGAGQPALSARGLAYRLVWDGSAFRSAVDPREDLETWRERGMIRGFVFAVRSLDFNFGSGGPSDIAMGKTVRDSQLPSDHFGLIAHTELRLPAGRVGIRTRSDDGIRVFIDDEVVIDEWTWHAPQTHEAIIESDEERSVELRIEYFELDGHAELGLEFFLPGPT